jgi:hypothetical protein
MASRMHVDGWSALVMAGTLVLFLIALFTVGFTHDLLLEAGVFLVSVKLILVGHKINTSNAAIQQQLQQICAAIQQQTPLSAPPRGVDGDHSGAAVQR